MELSWKMRFRIAGSLAIGVALVGLLASKLVKMPQEEISSYFIGQLSIGELLIFAALAFAAGFLASAISTPLGRQIGIIATPAGLSFWALKSQPLSRIFQMAPAVVDRVKIYSSLKFEGFIWLGIVICGYIGAFIADKNFRKSNIELPDRIKPPISLPAFIAVPIIVIGTTFVAGILVNMLGGSISYIDPRIRYVTAQPANLQIAFSVLVAFGACGFLAKIFLNGNSFWPAITSSILTYYAAINYGREDILTYLSTTWPANFYVRPVAAILPIQMVAFGFLGAVWGYWLAVDYYLWRTHQG